MSKKIEKQGIEGRLGCCSNGTIVVISPMPKTRPKQGIEEKWGYRSNVYKSIVKQGTEGNLGYCANGPMTNGKSYF